VAVFSMAQEPTEVETVETLAWLSHDFDFELIHGCRCVNAACDDPLFRQLLTGGI
jgi:hypothetical protein